MLTYVVVFWVGLVGFPDMGVQKVVIEHQGSPQSCATFAGGEGQDWADKHAAWSLADDEPHHPRCVEKRDV